MRQDIKLNGMHRILSMVLVIVMILSMVPMGVLAASTPSTLTTNISDLEFVVGEAMEFTFKTVANDDAGTMVKGAAVFSDPDAIEKLEYYEVQDGQWYELTGEFGGENGFPMTDYESRFRVTFKKAGVYTVDAYMKTVDGDVVLCSAQATACVSSKGSSLTTDISSKVFVAGEDYTEFTFTTWATEDAGKLVRGYFEFSDREALTSLQYYNVNTGTFDEFYGDFGPATGFPLTDNTTSTFRASFNKAGTYTVKAYMQAMDGTIVSVRVADVIVKARSEISYTMSSMEIKYTDVNAINDTLVNEVEGAEFTYESDNEAVVKVNEYGVLTPVSLGDATITVTRKENAGFVASTASYTVKVVAGDQAELVWNKSVPTSIVWNDPAGYSNTVKEESGSGSGKVSYTSNNTDVAEVDANGVLSIKKPGTVTITATKEADEHYNAASSSYTLVVVAAEQAPLVFDKPNPDAIYYGDDTFVNAATGGSTGGTVVYESSDPEVAEVDENGKVIAHKSGTVTITATLAGDEYYVAATPATYSLTIYRADQKTQLVFSKGDTNQTIPYGTTDYKNEATGGDTAPITYTSSDETVASVDPTTGLITTHKAGVVTITATAPETEQYSAQKLSYQLTVELAEQSVVFKQDITDIPAITYGESYGNGATAATKITYSSSDKTVAEVDADGNLIIHKSGTVTITATAAETEQYRSNSASYTITVNQAAQIVTFEKGNEPSMTFNDNENVFENPASTNATTGDEDDRKGIECLYSIVSGGEYIVDGSFDEATGKFTVKGAGTIIISVSFGANERYKMAAASYKLNVGKAEQSIAFKEAEYTTINGNRHFAAPTIVNEGAGTGEITYSIKQNDDNVVKRIDAESGELEFTGNTGSVTILATKAACDNYQEATAEYKLTVVSWSTDGEQHYTIVGDKINQTAWYTGNVSINADDGYLLSYERSKQAEWKETLEDAVVEDGKHEISFYVREASSGNITGKVTVQVLKDATRPTAEIKHQNLTGWEKFLTIITLGTWAPDNRGFTIVANDATSEVDKTEYYIAEGTTEVMSKADLDDITEWKKYDEKISVAKDQIFVVYAKVTDVAGNYIYAFTNGVVFDESEVPAENIVFELPEDTNGFYNGDVTVDVSITDAQPSSGIQSVTYEVLNNGVSTQKGTLFTFDVEDPKYEDLVPSWSTTEENRIVVDASKNNSDNVVVRVTVVDNAGNSQTKEVSLKICTTPLELVVSFVDDPAVINTYEGVDYYDTDRVAKFVITGRTSVFKESDIAVPTVNASVADTYEIVGWETAENLENPDAATHTLLVKFKGDATYHFELNDADIFGSKLTYTSNKFVVDKTNPTATVSTMGKPWYKLIEVLSFGLWSNETVYVTATASDATSPVKIEYCKTDSTTKLTDKDLDAVTSWAAFNEFEIEKDEKFVVYLRVMDYAGNYIYISTDGVVVDKTPSAITLTPDETTLEHNDIPLYNKDVNVLIDVQELTENAYSGINKVEYWVKKDRVETQRETLYTFSVEDPAYEDLQRTFSQTVTIDSELNNSCDVVLYVGVTDNAGNYEEASVAVDIDIMKPTITLSYNNNSALNDKYFGAPRTATVEITERPEHFNAENASAGIVITAYNAKNEEVIDDYTTMIGSWTTEGTGDTATHTATVAFNKDANYTCKISYADLAGNANITVGSGSSVAPFNFVVDTTDPTATVSTMEITWDKLIEVLSFGLWSSETVRVTAAASDATSPVKIEYCKTDSTTKLTDKDLDAVTSWAAFNEFEIEKDEKFVVYLRVMDYAGNYIYISTDGVVVDKTPSAITLTPDETTLEHNGTPLYNKDVNVLIDVQELTENAYSGINKVEYWVKKDGVETQRETLYTFSVEDPAYEDLQRTFSQTVTIDSKLNNSCDVVLYVGVTDNAGNYEEASVAVDIDITAPTIVVSYDNNAAYKIVENKGYFPAGRTATVKITERTAHFDAALATQSIQITALNAKGEAIMEDCAALIGKWTTQGTGDEAIHTAIIDFTADANYDFTLSYEDLATNKCEYENVKFAEGTEAPRYFAVDKTAPTGTVTVGTLGTWHKLIETLTFGLWDNKSAEVSVTSDDETTPIASVMYYKTADTEIKSVKDLNKLYDDGKFFEYEAFTVDPNEKFVVYIRIVDYAGNYIYISTDGIILDNVPPVVDSVTPVITLTPTSSYDIYNSNVTFHVSVVDPKSGDTEAYTGLKEIRYEVRSMDVMTQEGVLYSFPVENPTHDQLRHTWSSTDEDGAYIVVDKDLNNSNDVEVIVYAVDNVGHTSKAQSNIKIDVTKPAISVRYDNNDGDQTFADGVYFDANRTATITVTERNFDPEMVKLLITNTDGYIPVISGWTIKEEGTGNGDNTTHEATVRFDRDGDYTFQISCQDAALNDNTAVDFGSSLAPEAFTVDKTAPVVSIVYDNNDVLNGNYYKAERTATITVTEHNFETSRVVTKLLATDNGVPATVPVISQWISEGDVHTAVIKYTVDARYVFDFDYKDKAGNATADIAEQVFFVDKTNPTLSISGIVDESANNAQGNIGFVITANDTNFDVFEPILTAVIKNGDKFETKQLDIAEITDVENGKVYTVTNIEADGIYRITCTLVDKAGNAYSCVTLDKLDGTTHTVDRSGNDTLVTFSVNRDGSTFEIDSETMKVVEQYYIQNVQNDVVVVETNADPLTQYTVTLNGKELTEGTDYTVSEEGGNGAWMKYTYTVNKDLFADEGEYKLVVSSKDKAENDAFSDIKDATIAFVVDRTAPVVTVSGLANDGRYQTESQVVTLIPTDDGGALKTLIVRMVDEDGEVIKELINLSGDALAEALAANGGKIDFEIGEGLYQNVQIICTDEATGSGEDTNVHDVTFTNVSVSTSMFMIFWANKPLRWGTIGGLIAVIIGLILFIFLKKKKRKEDQ